MMFLRFVTLLLLTCSFRMTLASSSALLDQLHPNVKTLVQQLALASSSSSSPQQQQKEEEEEQQAVKLKKLADLWKRLGKTQLDAREYAEARRIFCRGAKLCPFDEKLYHHFKVWKAFHDDDDDENENDDGQQQQQQQHAEKEEGVALDTAADSATTNLPSVPPPLTIPNNYDEGDLFLNLDVPREAIPIAIKKWKGNLPSELRGRLIHASTKPILSKEACTFLIQSAIETSKKRGWTKDRHIQAPTCDIPVFDLPPQARHWFKHAMQHHLLPQLANIVSPELVISSQELQIQDCFIVRYDGDGDDDNEKDSRRPGFASLRPHEDESLLSLTIALNDQCEYEGGGLYIHSTGDLLNGDAGTVLCFAGQLVHGGYPVTRGTRWILTVFLYVDGNESGKPKGYTLDALDAIIAEQKQQQQQQTS